MEKGRMQFLLVPANCTVMVYFELSTLLLLSQHTDGIKTACNLETVHTDQTAMQHCW